MLPIARITILNDIAYGKASFSISQTVADLEHGGFFLYNIEYLWNIWMVNGGSLKEFLKSQCIEVLLFLSL